ncbi:MAG: MAPEG family protein [Panacagrimonas sp.]
MIVTSLYAGLLALWFVVLSLRVVRRRRGHRINLGDGSDTQMQRLIRGHGNFSEYVPLILLLMLILEMGGVTPFWLLHLIGITLVVARVLHGIALSFTQHFMFGRVAGTVLTFVLLLVTGLLCLWRGIAELVLAAG